MMKTGTGITRANGDTPDPFAVTVMFTQHKLELLHGRFTMVLVGLILITLYLIGSTIVGVLTPADFIFLLGTIFLAYRLSKLNEEIRETEQHLHGEGLPALD
jgi:hypothetical protein